MNAGQWLDKVRETRPLVHNITNLVVTNVTANTLLALGASPVMAYAHEEVADMARVSKALALNIGTLTPEIITAMHLAGISANAANVPIVFDPAGVGATPYRNLAATDITSSLRLTVLRANAGEMGFLLGVSGDVIGMDSVGASAALLEAMRKYARDHKTVVVATGELDYVTDGDSVWQLANGHPLLATTSGSGCALTSVIGAFVGSVPRGGSSLGTYAEAVVAAITCYNVAGEQAAETANGPGTFQPALLDALYHLTPSDVNAAARVSELG